LAANLSHSKQQEADRGWRRKLPQPCLLLLALQVGLGQSVVVVLLPVLASRCGVRFEALAAILAAGALAFLVAAPLFGRLSDRVGRSRVLMLAAGGIAAGQVVFGVTAQAAAWGLLPFALVLVGLASGRIAYAAAAAGALPVAQAHVADVVTLQERLGALAWLGAATTAGRLLAPPLAALATLIAPFAPLHLLSALALGTAIAIARLRGQQGPALAKRELPSRAPSGPVLAAMFVMLLVGVVQVSLGPWLEAGLGLQDLAASRWLGVLLGVAAAGALAAQLLAVPRIGGSRQAAFLVAGVMLASGAVVLELATVRLVSVAGAVLLGLGLGVALPLCAAAVAGSGQAGAALGRLSAAQVLGHAAGAAAGGMLLAAGMGTAVVAPALMLSACIAFAIHSCRR
jgi:MFS family permease